MSSIPGDMGGVLTGWVYLERNKPLPKGLELKLVAEWNNPSWYTVEKVVTLDCNLSGLIYQWSAGNLVCKISMANDFEKFENSTSSQISWKVQFDDSTTYSYSGEFFIHGQGELGKIRQETISFPCLGDSDQAKLLIDINVYKADNTVINKHIEHSIHERAIIFTRKDFDN